ncbi:MAG: hypothetical protein SFY80_02745 [Verrucomicrobiota bacterium]|nr:hypothetical protein [Verrucomicrobiota bacterium]
MINNPKVTWIPLTEKFLVSWGRVDADRLPEDKILLADKYGRHHLEEDYNRLVTHLEEEARLDVLLDEAIAKREGLHSELLSVVRAYNRYFSISDKTTGLRRLVVRTPSRKGGAERLAFVCRQVESVWRKCEYLDTDRSPIPSKILGFTTDEFLARINELEAVCTNVRNLKFEIKGHQINARNLIKSVIQPRLVAYRRMVYSQYAANHPLVLSIPELRIVNPERRRRRSAQKPE